MALRLVQLFQGASVELQRALAQFERAVDDELRRIDAVHTPLASVTPVKRATYAVRAGEVVLYDASASPSFELLFPKPSAANASRTITTKNVSTSASAVVMRVIDGLVDGAATESVAASRASRTYVSDGVSTWHKVAST